MCLLLPIDNH